MTGAQWIFGVLGPLFLVLAAWRWNQTGRLGPQAKTWLIIGMIFSAVAVWLWLRSVGAH
jgi:hypothetical protein